MECLGIRTPPYRWLPVRDVGRPESLPRSPLRSHFRSFLRWTGAVSSYELLHERRLPVWRRRDCAVEQLHMASPSGIGLGQTSRDASKSIINQGKAEIAIRLARVIIGTVEMFLLSLRTRSRWL